ncbi:MAG: FtsX-like permease family protein [Candidatus Korobacteraceae bacterium]
MPRLRLFYRLIIRPLYREPLRTALVVLAVALGVAVVVAIELAGGAAAGSFRSSIETLAGGADLEVTSIGGVPDELVGKLTRLPYPIQARPRIEDYAVVTASGQSVPLVGLDLVAERPENLNSAAGGSATFDDFTRSTNEGGIWISEHLGAKAGTTMRLQINDETREYKVRGILHDSGDSGGLVLMDIAAAQRALHRDERVDRILLKLPSTPSLEDWEQRLRPILPTGVELRREGAQTDENRRMLSAFRWNLRILSYVALVVGAFLIFNTISVSVVRRRAEIGIVRALGASRSGVLAAFLGEALCLGLVGGAFGLLLGRLLAIGAVNLIGRTVQNLYVSSQPAPIALTPVIIIFGLAIGAGISLASAASPAREASLVAPVEAMARGEREYAARMHKVRDLWIALLLAVLGAAASQAPAIAGKPFFGYASALLMIAACAFAIPALVSGLTAISSGLLRRVAGVEAFLASRSLAASLRRTSVLVGALATAIAMTTSVGIMVGSFRQTVQVWMDNQLKADLFLRPAGDPAADRHPTIDPALADKIASLPGVAGIDRFRGYEISYEGLPASLGAADTTGSHDLGKVQFLSGRSIGEVNAELRSGDNAIVSEPFANKHRLHRGDFISLPLSGASVRFHVVDVFYDYGSEKGFVVIDRSTLLRYVHDSAPSNLAVYVVPGANVDQVRTEIEKAAAGHNLMIFTNRNLRTEAIQIFDRTFAITYALEVIAVIVAVIGIAGALLALVIDRRRELGLLRFLGAAVSQVRKLILVEAGLIGLLANLAGLALGVVLSLLLIFVINKQSFGWTIQFHWPVAVLVTALTLVYLSTILAGFYPARVAARLNPIEVVHEE